MQRHFSIGSTLLAALMAAGRQAEPLLEQEEAGTTLDVVRLLSSLGDSVLRQSTPRPAVP